MPPWPGWRRRRWLAAGVLLTKRREPDASFAPCTLRTVACGWITDHFGVSWQIDPKLLIDMVTDPDPVKASKAMQAMMTMVKIDSEQLKRDMAK